MSLPNQYLRCESRRPRSSFMLGLWKYSLGLVIVVSATLDALWLVPAQEQAARDAEVSAYHHALWFRCRAAMHQRHHEPAPLPPPLEGPP